MATDLTRGSPTKQILIFAIPFLIGNLFQQLYNIVDMVIVGRTLGSLAYAAVGSTGTLVNFAGGAIIALAGGFGTMTARFVGEKNEESIKRSFASSIKLIAAVSILASVLCALLARPMLILMRTPEALLDNAYRYSVFVFGGLCMTALYHLLASMVRALGDSRTPLYFLVISSVLNIALDILFITAFRMGTAGAGLATVLSQFISGLLCIAYIAKKYPILHLRREHFTADRKMSRALLRLGVPMALLNMVISLGSIVVHFVTNGFGETYVSAQVTGAKIESFLTLPLLSFGSALSVYTAQNYGARNYERILRGVKRTIFMSFAWCGIAALILVPLGKWIIRWIAGSDMSDTVVDYAYSYILINTSLTLVLSILIAIKSVLPAVGRTTYCLVSGFTEIIGRAGTGLLVISLVSSAMIGESAGFLIICLANPAAWLFGLLTVLADYVLMRREFRRLLSEKAEIK